MDVLIRTLARRRFPIWLARAAPDFARMSSPSQMVPYHQPNVHTTTKTRALDAYNWPWLAKTWEFFMLSPDDPPITNAVMCSTMSVFAGHRSFGLLPVNQIRLTFPWTLDDMIINAFWIEYNYKELNLRCWKSYHEFEQIWRWFEWHRTRARSSDRCATATPLCPAVVSVRGESMSMMREAVEKRHTKPNTFRMLHGRWKTGRCRCHNHSRGFAVVRFMDDHTFGGQETLQLWVEMWPV